MANAVAILDKIARNMKQRGVAAERVGETVEVTKANGTSVLTVSYVAKDVQSPMGGVDGTVSPFLGVGVRAPGSIKVKGHAGEETIGAVMSDAVALELMHEVAGYANDVVLEHGDNTNVLARVKGHEHLLGLGS